MVGVIFHFLVNKIYTLGYVVIKLALYAGVRAGIIYCVNVVFIFQDIV